METQKKLDDQAVEVANAPVTSDEPQHHEGTMEEQKYVDGETRVISLDSIVRDENQPRKHFDEEAISELAGSIKNVGLIQNIVVRPVENDKFMIVAGERRFRAYQQLYQEDKEKWGKISVTIKKFDDQKAMNVALLENIHRADLLPLERAEAIQEYKIRNKIEKDKDLAKEISLSTPSVSNILKLNDLDASIKKEIRDNDAYSQRELVKIARKQDSKAQIKAFETLKRKVAKYQTRSKKGDAESAPIMKREQTPEENALNSKRLFARCATEMDNLAHESDENFEQYKYKVASTIFSSLVCLERLSKVKDAISLEQTQKKTVEDLKTVLNTLIESEPNPEPAAAQTEEQTDTEQVSEPVQEIPKMYAE